MKREEDRRQENGISPYLDQRSRHRINQHWCFKIDQSKDREESLEVLVIFFSQGEESFEERDNNIKVMERSARKRSKSQPQVVFCDLKNTEVSLK